MARFRTPIRVVQMGLGPIGSIIARRVAHHNDFRLVGAIDTDVTKVGKDVGDVVGADPMDMQVAATVDVVEKVRPDVVVNATSSSISVIALQISHFLDLGISVISTCEELAYPIPSHREIARELDAKAIATNARVLGTGANPGFVMDFLPAILSLASGRIQEVRVCRVVDTGKRRLQLRQKTGAGLSLEEFQSRVASKSVGHVGLLQSIYLLAAGLGLVIQQTDEEIEPILVDRETSVDDISLFPGEVAGVHQTATGVLDSESQITLDLWMSVAAKAPRDEIHFLGDNPMSLRVFGGILGDTATAAIVLNCIPRLLTLQPGLLTMLDIPLMPRDVRIALGSTGEPF
jgi:4-hydroxy-tetrahydrodipicolinate reductase